MRFFVLGLMIVLQISGGLMLMIYGFQVFHNVSSVPDIGTDLANDTYGSLGMIMMGLGLRLICAGFEVLINENTYVDG